MVQQTQQLANTEIEKRVWLEDSSETMKLTLDSLGWSQELSFLKEVNPNQPEYVGAFEKEIKGVFQTLTLKETEKGPLKKVAFHVDDEKYQHILISFHEDKDVYIHHREIELMFNDGLINTLSINGYQQMIFKDTVKFGVEIKVN